MVSHGRPRPARGLAEITTLALLAERRSACFLGHRARKIMLLVIGYAYRARIRVPYVSVTRTQGFPAVSCNYDWSQCLLCIFDAVYKSTCVMSHSIANFKFEFERKLTPCRASPIVNFWLCAELKTVVRLAGGLSIRLNAQSWVSTIQSPCVPSMAAPSVVLSANFG